MRIELLASGSGSIGNFRQSLVSLHRNISETIRSLRDTNAQIGRINNSENLNNASANLQNRIRIEERNLASVEALGRKTRDFVQYAVARDRDVANNISHEREQLFRRFYWLRPPTPERRSGWSRFWRSVGNVFTRAWDGIVRFYQRHREAIHTVIRVVVTVVVAVASIAAIIKTGGLALVPILAKVGVKGKLAAGVSKTMGTLAISSTAGSTKLNVLGEFTSIKNNPRFLPLKNVFNVASKVTLLMNPVGAKKKLSVAPITSKLRMNASTAKTINRTLGTTKFTAKVGSTSLYSINAFAPINNPTFSAFQSTFNVISHVTGRVKF